MDKLKTCRCCVREIGNEDELHEFSSEVATDNDSQNFIKISECYAEITTINVAEDDEDNTKICSTCLGDLKFCFVFKRKCLEAAKAFEIEEHPEIGKF